MAQWIDVHTHINMLEGGPEENVRQAVAAGVERMITIGTCPDDHPTVLALTEKFTPYVYCTLGVHPHEAVLLNETVENFIRDNAPEPAVVAIGEIGLDYYYDHSPRETQQDAFRRQLQIAQDLSLPVEIHTRDAEPDTIKILREFEGKVKGLIHCFTGTQWLADQALAIGFNISFSGVLTFKNGGDLRAVARTVPLDRIHVETDAPFLTPVPFRGKKNTPAYVVHTAEVLAGLKGVTVDELAARTNENAKKLFTKLAWNQGT